MKSKIDVLRALSSIIAKRALLIIGIILTLIIIALLVTVSVLMNVSSAWWGLLLIIVIPCTLVAVIVFAILWFITRHLYTVPLNKHQKTLLGDFADKIQRLLESHGMGWFMFAFLCAKDLLIHRDLRTLQSLLTDTTSLKSDFTKLENALRQ